jgi:putative ABC transport system permease protein
LITLLFTVPTLMQVRGIRPGLILRRHVNASDWRRLRPATWLSGAGLALGVAALAVGLSDEPWRVAARDGVYFVAALLAAMAALAGVTWLLLRAARVAVGRWPQAPLALRHGLANLYRPGSLAQAVMMALGVGVMFTLTVFLLQHALLADLRAGTPEGVANVFLIDIPPPQAGAVMALLEHQAGLENAPEILPTARLRLPGARREISVATFAALPSGVRLAQGSWTAGARAIAVSQSLANAQHIRIGERIEDAPVTAIFQAEPHRMVARVELIASPGVLKNLPTTVNGGVRVAPAAIPGLERDMYAAFPTVTVVNIADVIERVEQVVDQIALVVHFIAFFAVFAGAIILASSVAGTRFRRMREIAILKTCGGTKGRIAAIFSTEFLLLGGVAGCAGCLLAVGFTWVIVHRLLEVPLGLRALPCLAAVAATAALAVVAGWAACARLLSTKPLEILRAE